MFCHTSDNHYNNLDYLIFSHLHPDHFSPDLVARYLLFNRVSRLLFPQDDSPRSKVLIDTIARTKTPCWQFEMKRGKVRQYLLQKTISITTLCTRHMPQMFADDLCCAVLVTINNSTILFLTDCSCEEAELLQQLSEINIHTVFVNPYFYHAAAGREILEKYLHPENIVIYHIPFAADDSIHIRNLVTQDYKRFPHPGLVLFSEPFQTLTIH
jgi:glyoxylase-like metal-dependent hydrolase (beta-lactamase superfamily II)